MQRENSITSEGESISVSNIRLLKALYLELQIFWWLTWLDEFDFEDTTLSNICDKVFETLEKKFKPTVVRFLISLLITSRDGLKETELIELMTESKLVEGNYMFSDKIKIESKKSNRNCLPTKYSMFGSAIS